MNRCIVLEEAPRAPASAWLALVGAAGFSLGVCLVLLLVGCGGRTDLSTPCELTAQNYEVTSTIIETSCPERGAVGTTNTGVVYLDPAKAECSGRTLHVANATEWQTWDLSTVPARVTWDGPGCGLVYSATLEAR